MVTKQDMDNLISQINPILASLNERINTLENEVKALKETKPAETVATRRRVKAGKVDSVQGGN